MNWDKQIKELEIYFDTKEITDQPIKLNKATVITDVKVFIKSHLGTVKKNNGNRTFLPYLERLIQLKTIIK